MLRRWWQKKQEQWSSDTIPYTDPLTAGRHPFQIYLLALASLSGGLQLIGASPPDSLDRELPEWQVLAWSWMLFGGAFGALIGSFWPREDYANGLTVERMGLMATGVSGCIYGTLLIYNVGMTGAIAGGITIGFGLSCIIRARHIGKIFTRAIDPSPPDVDTEEGR